MTKTIPNNYNDQYEINENNETWNFNAGSTLTNPDGHGIHEASSFHDNLVNVNGTINALSIGSAGVAIQGLRSDVVVGSTGTINGWYGVELFGDQQSVVNNGTLNVLGQGIFSDGIDNSVINNGTIKTHASSKSSVDGISVAGATDVINNGTGTISVNGHGIIVRSVSGEVTEVANFGSVTATNGFAFYGWTGNETFNNRGLVFGDISMGAGNDTFDGVNGSVSGQVMGGQGDDTYIISATDIILFEKAGEGTDHVRSNVAWTLKEDFENLTLEGSAAIAGRGNGKDNVITGNSGANRLFGFDGADTLLGGAGNDRLTGGTGYDDFVFKPGSGTDRIMDFTGGVDHIDLTDIAGINSFTDLKNNHLTSVNGDLVITSGAFKLILEDTTKSEINFFDFSF